MALSKADFGSFSVIRETALGTTAVNDVMGGPCRLTHVVAENAAIAKIMFYDDDGPTPGTTEPIYAMTIEDGVESSIPVNPPNGIVFSEALSMSSSVAATALALVALPGVS